MVKADQFREKADGHLYSEWRDKMVKLLDGVSTLLARRCMIQLAILSSPHSSKESVLLYHLCALFYDENDANLYVCVFYGT